MQNQGDTYKEYRITLDTQLTNTMLGILSDLGEV